MILNMIFIHKPQQHLLMRYYLLSLKTQSYAMLEDIFYIITYYGKPPHTTTYSQELS